MRHPTRLLAGLTGMACLAMASTLPLQAHADSKNLQPATLLPNLAGSLPNDIFADQLGLPTLWVPHSYPACAQHAPNEHLLGSVAREGLAVMAGLFWDLGEAQGTPWKEGRIAAAA